MKNKRILLISLTLALLAVLLVPSAAMAKSNRWQPPSYTSFNGGGMIYVTAMPDPIVQGKIWCYQGEIVEGLLSQSDWEQLANTSFWSTHDSIVRVEDDGTTFGWMWGTFTLTSLVYPDSVMRGNFTGQITGNLFFGNISDSGNWIMTSGTGVFSDVSAFGSWSADLVYNTDYATLVGPLNWQGKYSGDVKPYYGQKKTNFQWSPVKPWKPYTPGMYSWFRKR